MLSPAPQDGWTPLYTASDGHLEVVDALLAKGADVEAKDNVSIARACALCPFRLLAHMQNAHGCFRAFTCMYASPAVSQDGTSAA
jgi:hypothetical protein